MNKTNKIFLFLSIVLILVLLAGSALVSAKFSNYDYTLSVLQTKINGYSIIVALEKYKNDNGKYPSSLDLLVPDYLQGIRPPMMGPKEWIYYEDSDGQVFYIRAETNLSEGALDYESDMGFWYHGPDPTKI